MNKFVVLIELLLFVTSSTAQAWHPPDSQFDPQCAALKSFVSKANPPPRQQCLLWGQSFDDDRRDDYKYTRDVGGHKLHKQAVTWNEARMLCEDEGGHLAIINSIKEANAMAQLFKNSEPITGSPHPDLVHIGFHDLYQEGQHTTIHGQKLGKAGFNRWSARQPDNAGNDENCGSMGQNGELNDINCGIKLGFICELPIHVWSYI